MKGGARYGAGRPGWHATTAGKHRVDVRQLHRGGHLSGDYRLTWQWSDGANIQLDTSPDVVTLTYRYRSRGNDWCDVNQRVLVTRTACHYGKSRPWFICPRCHGRVAILYLWNIPLCRTCARLVYPSQSDDALARSWRRTRKIERRLAGGAEEWNYRRPKGMRMATYEKLLAAYWEEEKYRDNAFVEFALRRFPGLLDGKL